MQLRTLLSLVILSVALNAYGQELTVAAAADLTFALKEIGTNYEKQTGTHVKIIFGSSGTLTTQIENGAPFDILFSADITYPKKLEADGLSEPGSIYQYAVGRIVLWTLKDSKVDVSKGMNCLSSREAQHIAIANPEHAPYGRAAVAAMTKAGVYDQVKGKFVLGENVAQAMQFVDSGNSEVGVVALSLAISPTVVDKGRYWEVPLNSYPRIEQGAVVVKASRNKEAAKSFLMYVRGTEASAILKRYGFFLP